MLTIITDALQVVQILCGNAFEEEPHAGHGDLREAGTNAAGVNTVAEVAHELSPFSGRSLDCCGVQSVNISSDWLHTLSA